jgi:HEAT repeat protein
LHHENPRLRRSATEVLGKIGAAAKPALSELKQVALRDADSWVRFVALRAYGEVQEGRKEKLSTFTACLVDESPDVRGLAARSLGGLGLDAGPAVPELIRSLQDDGYRAHAISIHVSTQRAVRYDAAEALGKIGSAARQAVEPLIGTMNSDANPEVRAAAALAVCRIDKQHAGAMDVLIALLGHDEQGTAGPIEAARSLAELGPQAKPALKALATALQHDDDLVRINAVRAIAQIGGEEAAALLLKAMKDKELFVRESAVTGLGELGPAALPALAYLRDALREDSDALSSFVRCAAATSLGKLGPAAKSAIADLEQSARKDEDEFVRAAATEALKLVSGQR